MNMELLNYINVDMTWNIVKRGRRSMTRRPRKPGADNIELGNKTPDPAAFEFKSGSVAEKVVDAPLKKRRLLRQSSSPPRQTPRSDGEGVLSPGPQTPSVHDEDPGQRCRSDSLSHSQKTKSKSGLLNSDILNSSKKDVFNLDDFSGIELLAAAACSSFIQDTADHVEDFSVSKEHMTPGVNSSTFDIKETVTSTESDGSSIQVSMVPDTHDSGNKEGEKMVAPSKESRLHWDLNTVMDEWEEPQIHDNCSECIYNGGSDSGKLNSEGYKSKFAEEKGMLDSKTSDGESSASKSDVVDWLIPPGKCEDFSISTTSVLREQSKPNTISKSDQQPISEEEMQGECRSPKLCKSDCDDKGEGCGSDVTQDEHCHMAEGDTMDKVQVGYDSPFEDGELREPTGWEENEVEEKETVCYESDNIYKDEFGTTENPLSEKIKGSCGHGETMEDQSSLVKEAISQADTFEKASGCQLDVEESDCGSRKELSERKNGHIDDSTSFDVCRNDVYVRRSRSSNGGDSNSRHWRDLDQEKSKVSLQEGFRNDASGASLRVWDLKSSNEYQRLKNVAGDPVARSSGWRSLESNQSRNYNPRRPPPVRSHSRDRFHSQGLRKAPEEEYHDSKPCYIERKGRFSPNFNRPWRRSRSGSPIAWHFKKQRNSETRQLPDHETRFQGYPERLKSDDHFRFSQRPGREYKYKDNRDVMRKLYEREKRMGRSDDVRRFRHTVDESFETRNRRNMDSFSRDASKEHSCFKEGIPESKS